MLGPRSRLREVTESARAHTSYSSNQVVTGNMMVILAVNVLAVHVLAVNVLAVHVSLPPPSYIVSESVLRSIQKKYVR